MVCAVGMTAWTLWDVFIRKPDIGHRYVADTEKRVVGTEEES